jgi:CheY-like chemotaxis protein
MSKTILIVDDDKDIVMLQKRLIQRLGYTDVLSADDGFQALHFLAEIEPDVVFLDIQMPGLDGWLLCEILHKVDRWKHIPVVLQSALVGAENIKKGLDLGAHTYLEKPFTQDGLKSVLDAVFQKDDSYTQKLPAPVQPVVMHVVDAVKQTFNLILGTQARVREVYPLPHEMCEKTWEYVGGGEAEGVVSVGVSMGWSRELALASAQSLMVMQEEDIDESIIIDSLNQIVEMILSTALRSLNRVYPLTPGQAISLGHGQLQVIEESEFKYAIDIKAGEHEFPVVVTTRTQSE